MERGTLHLTKIEYDEGPDHFVQEQRSGEKNPSK